MFSGVKLVRFAAEVGLLRSAHHKLAQGTFKEQGAEYIYSKFKNVLLKHEHMSNFRVMDALPSPDGGTSDLFGQRGKTVMRSRAPAEISMLRTSTLFSFSDRGHGTAASPNCDDTGSKSRSVWDGGPRAGAPP